ncbi:GNAT family N-acetyltransferase [Legionella bononiensis]|uniref:GNAT family N-acetyltransferase n=1 Tax=Legionella bononiensis TaxID=2793102 RepID=A0ABS1WBR4_9GAMM|nr:GNAT family N-acetyltransferase [Legionella bononiensis]MBL7481087.1 GNAT family N-acetyltransferase [Legionella bononiensis]MBL7526796.1 GNAT family N-acetyltransferase [Legionella bononiensis]MBL7564203.1 GNAT family N-acetyltransferase [Legionella bononiensis]
MLLFSSAKPTVTFTKLNQVNEESFSDYLEMVTKWFTNEWGYIHDKIDEGKYKEPEQAIEDRMQYLTENADRVYLAFYKELLVGAFRIENKMVNTNEIWFIYVDPTARGLGVGRQIVQEIKRLSKDEMANIVLLETLKPSLNHLYKSEGAEQICDNTLDNNPTDVLRIKL